MVELKVTPLTFWAFWIGALQQVMTSTKQIHVCICESCETLGFDKPTLAQTTELVTEFKRLLEIQTEDVLFREANK